VAPALDPLLLQLAAQPSRMALLLDNNTGCKSRRV